MTVGDMESGQWEEPTSQREGMVGAPGLLSPPSGASGLPGPGPAVLCNPGPIPHGRWASASPSVKKGTGRDAFRGSSHHSNRIPSASNWLSAPGGRGGRSYSSQAVGTPQVWGHVTDAS